jgi:hypothetical protein
MTIYDALLERLLVAQMAWDGFGASTIAFFRAVYPMLLSLDKMNSAQMAEVANFTPQAVKAHRDLLEQKNYIVRHNYRTWTLNREALRDPILLAVLRVNVPRNIWEKMLKAS